MALARHRLSIRDLHTLARGSGGAEVARRLVDTQHGARLLLIWGVMDAARRAAPARAAPTRDAYVLLTELQRRHPAAAETVLWHPAVGAWAHSVLRALRDGTPGAAPASEPAPESEPAPAAAAAAEPGELAAIAAAVMIRAGERGSVRVPAAADGGVMLPSVGSADIGRPGETVLVRSAGAGAGTELTVPGARVVVPAEAHRDAPGWRGMRSLRAAAHGIAVRALIDDLDPHRLPGAPLTGRLGRDDAAGWQAMFEPAWDLLVRHHWTTAAEIRTVIRALVPLAAPPSGQRSATSTEAFGGVGTSRPADPVRLAVTLAHEVQHAKLAALLDIVALVRADGGDADRRYYAPWREDPRPIGGLLQGAYAHLGVTGFWRRQRYEERGAAAIAAHAEFARWRAVTLPVTNTLLASGRLTEAGMEFVSGMRRTLAAWAAEPVPAPALSHARQAAELHRTRWRRRNSREPLTG